MNVKNRNERNDFSLCDNPVKGADPRPGIRQFRHCASSEAI
uniref:Uncharacterized protein n=1 Tax=Anopheles funestus TaxID=62324 RepID=A0A4Y0BDY4_ANOFN